MKSRVACVAGGIVGARISVAGGIVGARISREQGPGVTGFLVTLVTGLHGASPHRGQPDRNLRYQNP